MNAKTLQGLKDSIEKWRQIERGEMPDLKSHNCGLCLAVSDKSGNIDCTKCPVMQKTGKASCCETPYDKWLDTQLRRDGFCSDCSEWVADTPALVRLARAERKFLESLLPKGKP